MLTVWVFDNIENKHSSYRENYCMTKFCIFFREHAANIINFKNKNILPLTKKS